MVRKRRFIPRIKYKVEEFILYKVIGTEGVVHITTDLDIFDSSKEHKKPKKIYKYKYRVKIPS